MPGHRRPPIAIGVLTAFLLLGLAPRAWCAWPHDPLTHLRIAPTTADQLEPSVAADGQGGAYVAFIDTRAGNTDIYVQRVTAAGAVAPGWPAAGVAVCTQGADQYTPAAISDGAGGVVVVWTDMRAGGSNGDIYAQRLRPTGAVPSGWPANGRQLTTNAKHEFGPVVTTDGARGAIVAWTLEFTPGVDHDVYAARVDSGGTVVWNSAISAPVAFQDTPAITSDGSGGAIIAYPDNLAGNYDIMAVRRTATGSVVYGPIVLCDNLAPQVSPSIAGDGQGGAIAAWSDTRSGNYDIYAMGITPSGGAPPVFNADGNPVCTAPVNQMSPMVVSDGNRGVYVAWRDERNFDWDLFLQRILPVGVVATGWPVNGLPLCTIQNQQTLQSLVSDNLGGVVATWLDARTTAGPVGIYASRVLPSASLAPGWSSNGTLIAMLLQDLGYPSACADADGHVTIAWQDSKHDPAYHNIYAQRVDTFGQLGNPEPAITRVRDVLADQGGQVRIDWTRSYLDVNPTFGVDAYWIWRQAPAAQAQLALQQGGRVIVAAELAALARGSAEDWRAITLRGLYMKDSEATTAYLWEFIDEVEASGFPSYSYVAATTTDSTGAHNYYTPFMVQARGSGVMFWSSAPDSGYSVDNLPPAAPAPFFGVYGSGSTALHWGPNSEADFASYRLHRGNSAGFVPAPGNLISAQPDTGFVDAGPAGSYYKLAAVDAHENISAYSLLTPNGTVDVPTSLPQELALRGPQPNPVVTSCLIPFDLPRGAEVSIAVYDVAGRAVRQLQRGKLTAGAHVVRWDAHDAWGRRVGAGLFMVRMSVEGRIMTTRVMVLR